ncbi:hypothetical protein ACOSP7_007292 [Xanthoceras sorbifolium]
MKCGTRSVTVYARAFKALCDQLHAIGRPIDATDKVHWFLRGLGPDFSSFSTAQIAQASLPCFSDLVSKAENFELFQKSLETPASSAAAFTAHRTASYHGVVRFAMDVVTQMVNTVGFPVSDRVVPSPLMLAACLSVRFVT